MSAIDDLERLAMDVEDHVVIGLDEIAYQIRFILTSLRTEKCEGMRESFVAGSWYGRVVGGPILDNSVAQRGSEAEALRRYKEV